jgi:hypothetical protein
MSEKKPTNRTDYVAPQERVFDARLDLPSHDDIANVAHTLGEARGGGDGGAIDDWLEAQRLFQEPSGKASNAIRRDPQAARAGNARRLLSAGVEARACVDACLQRTGHAQRRYRVSVCRRMTSYVSHATGNKATKGSVRRSVLAHSNISPLHFALDINLLEQRPD